jgi:hypothetical protein
MKLPDIVVEGKENGEGMIIRSQTGKGTEIYGLGIPNVYTDSDWSLGPTWCYLIMGKKKDPDRHRPFREPRDVQVLVKINPPGFGRHRPNHHHPFP